MGRCLKHEKTRALIGRPSSKSDLFVQNYMEHCLEIILEMKELTDIILCVLLMNMINNIHRRMLPAEPEAIINKYMGVV